MPKTADAKATPARALTTFSELNTVPNVFVACIDTTATSQVPFSTRCEQSRMGERGPWLEPTWTRAEGRLEPYVFFLRDLPADRSAIATACFGGLPWLISRRMLDDIVLRLLPFFNGMADSFSSCVIGNKQVPDGGGAVRAGAEA